MNAVLSLSLQIPSYQTLKIISYRVLGDLLYLRVRVRTVITILRIYLFSYVVAGQDI